MHEVLQLPADHAGMVWLVDGRRPRRRHRHAELELNLVLAGRARYLLAGGLYELEPRSALFLFPAQDHVLVDATSDFAMWVAVFTPDLLARHCRSAATAALRSADPGRDWCRRLPARTVARLDGLARRVGGVVGHADHCNAGLAWLLFEAWQALVAGVEDPPPPRAMHPAVAMALRQLARAPGMQFDTAALARVCGLSPGRLGRLFKQQVGCELGVWRTRRRLEEVRYLLAHEPARSLAGIAATVGFGSYSAFHRAVRRSCGCSPEAWRAVVLGSASD
ncbi:MAG: helix-turn-helix domain-containing protein [Planctomycetota bacterium]